MSFPECSIAGIKPIIEPIPYDIVEQEIKKWSKFLLTNTWKRCCICGNVSTQKVSYPIQGAVRIERYCDRCAERQFDRST